MTIQHCPLTDLNLFAAEQAKMAMGARIANAKNRLKRAEQLKEAGDPLWIASSWKHDLAKPKKTKRYFFIWTEENLSPYAIIADSESRISDLDKRIAELKKGEKNG